MSIKEKNQQEEMENTLVQSKILDEEAQRTAEFVAEMKAKKEELLVPTESWQVQSDGIIEEPLDAPLQEKEESPEDRVAAALSPWGKNAIPFSAADLQDDESIAPRRFIVDEIVPTGVSMLAAPPKYYKSFLCLDMLTAIARGEPFLGQKTTKGPCLYISLEDNRIRLKERIDRLTDKSLPRDLQMVTHAPTLDTGLQDYLFRWITSCVIELRKWPSLIVIDTFQLIRGEQTTTNSYSSDYNDILRVKKYAAGLDIGILLVHHLRKLHDETDPFANISGTNGILGALDACFVLQKKSRMADDTSLAITGRDVPQAEYVMNFSTEDYRFHLKKDKVYDEKQALLAKFKQDDIVQTIRHLLDNSPLGWVTLTATQLLEKTKEYKKREPMVSDRKVKSLLLNYSGLLRSEYDIQYTTVLGNAGCRIHKFARAKEYYDQVKENSSKVKI